MPLPRNFNSYYQRFGKQARADLFRWGRSQVIGAAVTLAILLFQLYLGVIPTSMTLAALKSFVWPYLVVIAFFVVAAMLKAPVELDNERASEILQSTTLLQQEHEETLKLEDRLAAPRISALEQSRRDLVAEKLQDAGPQSIELVTYVLRHGQVDATALLHSAPRNEQRLYQQAIDSALGWGLLKVGTPSHTGYPGPLIPNPDLIDALSFNLLRDHASSSESSQT